MKKLLLIFITMLLFFPFVSNGAGIFFGVKSKEISVGSKLEVGVFINTQGEDINAIEGEIVFPFEYFELQGFYSGSSILTFWVTQPALASQGTVSFAGVAPGGFNGQKGYLFTIILKAKLPGSISINANNEKILLNDGQGSSAVITKAPLALRITEQKKPATQAAPPVVDTPFIPLYDPDPPEVFEPQIAKTNNIFEGKWFLTFITQDKGSGIDHYELTETPLPKSFKSLFSTSQFKIVESPYLLEDQFLKSIITIKAIDKAGNEVAVKVQPSYGLPWYENYFIWIILIVMGGLCIVPMLVKKPWIKKHK